MVKHLVCDDFLAGDAEPEEAAEVRRSQTHCVLMLPVVNCLATGWVRQAHSTLPAGCSLGGCWVYHSSPVLRWEEVQGPGLPAAAPLGRIGLQHFVQAEAAALGGDTDGFWVTVASPCCLLAYDHPDLSPPQASLCCHFLAPPPHLLHLSNGRMTPRWEGGHRNLSVDWPISCFL